MLFDSYCKFVSEFTIYFVFIYSNSVLELNNFIRINIVNRKQFFTAKIKNPTHIKQVAHFAFFFVY